jgi:hypothetical protein
MGSPITSTLELLQAAAKHDPTLAEAQFQLGELARAEDRRLSNRASGKRRKNPPESGTLFASLAAMQGRPR